MIPADPTQRIQSRTHPHYISLSFSSKNGGVKCSASAIRHAPNQPITDRIFRAIRHGLLLLHCVGVTFFVLGATGNVYKQAPHLVHVMIGPSHVTHILFVLIKALGVPHDAPCLRRPTLPPCQVNKLLVAPRATLQNRFHELSQQSLNTLQSRTSSKFIMEVGDGAACPVCLEEMERGEKAERCGTCRNLIHEDCLLRWKRSRGRRYANCVVCRAKWEKVEKEKYLNLAAYAEAENTSVSASQGGLCGNVNS